MKINKSKFKSLLKFLTIIIVALIVFFVKEGNTKSNNTKSNNRGGTYFSRMIMKHVNKQNTKDKDKQNSMQGFNLIPSNNDEDNEIDKLLRNRQSKSVVIHNDSDIGTLLTRKQDSIFYSNDLQNNRLK